MTGAHKYDNSPTASKIYLILKAGNPFHTPLMTLVTCHERVKCHQWVACFRIGSKI